MPVLKTHKPNTRRTYKKNARVYKKKGGFNRPQTTPISEGKNRLITIQSGKLPFCQDAYWRVPFAEEFELISFLSPLAHCNYIYNASSCYDPRFNLGGGQPIQYDQISPLYERYWITKVDCEVTFANPREDGAFIGVRVRGSTDTLATQGRTTYELMELPNTRYSFLSNTGSQRKTFKFSVSPRKILGLTKEQYGNLEYSGLCGSSSPQAWVYIEPFIQNSRSDALITVYVKLTYHIHMTNPISKVDV